MCWLEQAHLKQQQINVIDNIWLKMERAKRFELSTPTLARLCSTPELRPLGAAVTLGDMLSSSAVEARG